MSPTFNAFPRFANPLDVEKWTTLMSLTRIDCHFFRGEGVPPDAGSYVALSPENRPGTLVVAGATAVRAGIGSQVSCRLALEHYVGGVLKYFAGENLQLDPETSIHVLEAAFKEANSSVYEFGVKLAAAGRMASSLVGLVIEGNVVAAARAGGGVAYLIRKGEVFPFFENKLRDISDPTLGLYVGVQPLVAVEIASVPIIEGDIIAVFSRELDRGVERELVWCFEELDFSSSDACAQVSRSVFHEPETLVYGILARVGPEVIYLNEKVA